MRTPLTLGGMLALAIALTACANGAQSAPSSEQPVDMPPTTGVFDYPS